MLAAVGELLLDTTPPPLLRAMLLAESNDPCTTPAVSPMSAFDAEEEALPPLPTRCAASGGGAEPPANDTMPATERPLRALLDVLLPGGKGSLSQPSSAAGFGPLHLVNLTLTPTLALTLAPTLALTLALTLTLTRRRRGRDRRVGATHASQGARAPCT